MFIEVSSKVDFKIVNKLIRTEDIKEIYESPYDENETIVVFYDEREDLTIQQPYKELSDKLAIISHFYSEEDEQEEEEENNPAS